MATDYYSGTIEDVQTVLRNVRIGENRISDISLVDIEKFMAEADSVINSIISPLCRVPLFKISRGGSTFYPHPVPYIARRIVTSLAITSIYSEIEPNISANAEEQGSRAIRELNDFVAGILKGSRVLEGQKMKARNRFVNPRAAPQESPGARDKI